MKRELAAMIQKLNFKEMVEARNKLDEMIEEGRGELLDETVNSVRQMVQESGFDFDALFKLKGGRIAKYRNPANPSDTWTGRGRKPRWLREKIEQAGGDEAKVLEKFQIAA